MRGVIAAAGASSFLAALLYIGYEFYLSRTRQYHSYETYREGSREEHDSGNRRETSNKQSGRSSSRERTSKTRNRRRAGGAREDDDGPYLFSPHGDDLATIPPPRYHSQPENATTAEVDVVAEKESSLVSASRGGYPPNASESKQGRKEQHSSNEAIVSAESSNDLEATEAIEADVAELRTKLQAKRVALQKELADLGWTEEQIRGALGVQRPGETVGESSSAAVDTSHGATSSPRPAPLDEAPANADSSQLPSFDDSSTITDVPNIGEASPFIPPSLPHLELYGQSSLLDLPDQFEIDMQSLHSAGMVDELTLSRNSEQSATSFSQTFSLPSPSPVQSAAEDAKGHPHNGQELPRPSPSPSDLGDIEGDDTDRLAASESSWSAISAVDVDSMR
ncbi:hypothetical protein DFS34DRAFT_649932 [Phlyctochytrium arcticum]|nr:hypothetical protein DFS34DRAFT_649932 [Phlyctochytrium arcticum]